MGKCKRCGKEVRFPIMLHPACWEVEVGKFAEKLCDKYCRFPSECKNQDELDEHCNDCDLVWLLNFGGSRFREGAEEGQHCLNFGDKVYCLNEDDIPEKRRYISTETVTALCKNGFCVSGCNPPEDDCGCYIEYKEIGETVFLTREAAEEALKGDEKL